jgi:hypothetical protein
MRFSSSVNTLLLVSLNFVISYPADFGTSMGDGEERVHGLDRGIRGMHASAPVREPSFSAASPEPSSI